eukprot:924263-Lingulodinium_polyedra.AAC.1
MFAKNRWCTSGQTAAELFLLTACHNVLDQMVPDNAEDADGAADADDANDAIDTDNEDCLLYTSPSPRDA